MDDNVGAYSNSNKIWFLHNFQIHDDSHLIVSWCDFPIFDNDQRNNKYNLKKVQFNELGFFLNIFVFLL
jgi:hypothetical protein